MATATETATIRVPRATRDLLASQAREQGVSLASLLGGIALQREAAAIWESERAASNADAQNLDVAAEDLDWAAALADGL